MKKILKIVGIILAVLIIIFVIYKIVTYKETPFTKFPFQKNHHVYNMTKVEYLDTIVNAGLQTLNIDSVIIIIKPIINKEGLLPDDLIAKANIVGKDCQYIIYVDKCSRSEYISVLSHELIHLKQYYKSELILTNKGKTPIWKGVTINVKDYTYENRPWEKEAYEDSNNLATKMKLLLY